MEVVGVVFKSVSHRRLAIPIEDEEESVIASKGEPHQLHCADEKPSNVKKD